MISSFPFRSYSYLTLVEFKDIPGKATRLLPSTVRCSSTRNVPKLEPFSRSRFDRVAKEPPLIEKSENELSDYCSTLEGDESYSCWRAYFELKELEKEAPRNEVEKLILQSCGVKSLIGCLHGIASIFLEGEKDVFGSWKQSEIQNEIKTHFHIPEGLPKSEEELEEEERGKMMDSPFTRLLRTKGRYPAWYSPNPYHLTD